eukprot:SAG22_NODE_724_length_7634_cov_11.669808_10_plen_59_part_00
MTSDSGRLKLVIRVNIWWQLKIVIRVNIEKTGGIHMSSRNLGGQQDPARAYGGGADRY